MRVGVLALQGAFREHIMMLEAAEVAAEAIRLPEQLAECAGLIIPGGESTAIGKLMETYGFYDAIPEYHAGGMALWGTCAGAVLIAKDVLDGAAGQRTLELMDIAIRRNAYGRQVDSFETDLAIQGIDELPYRGVFIRAPWIENVGEDVTVLSRHDDVIVAVAQRNLLATTFHPELTGDPRVHRLFVDRIIGS